jgi:hypothetical protein
MNSGGKRKKTSINQKEKNPKTCQGWYIVPSILQAKIKTKKSINKK